MSGENGKRRIILKWKALPNVKMEAHVYLKESTEEINIRELAIVYSSKKQSKPILAKTKN